MSYAGAAPRVFCGPGAGDLGHTLTPAADVFALGVLAHFTATGELAFGGSAPIVIHRIIEREPSLDDCPEPIRTITAACLDKDPQRRPTPAEVIRLCNQATAAGTADSDALSAASPPSFAPADSPLPGPGMPPATPTKRDTGQGAGLGVSATPPRVNAEHHTPTKFTARRLDRTRPILILTALAVVAATGEPLLRSCT